jgi:hypothetical protein
MEFKRSTRERVDLTTRPETAADTAMVVCPRCDAQYVGELANLHADFRAGGLRHGQSAEEWKRTLTQIQAAARPPGGVMPEPCRRRLGLGSVEARSATRPGALGLGGR